MVKRVKYLLEAAKPYQLIFGIFGPAPIPSLSKKAPIRLTISAVFYTYKLCLIAATLTVVLEGCKYLTDPGNFKTDFLSNGLQFVQLLTLTMIQFIMHMIVFLKYKHLKRIYFDVVTIERDLRHFSSKLHVDYSQRLFKRNLFFVSGLMLLTIFFTPVSNIYSIIQLSFPVLLWVISIFSKVAIRCKSVEFCVMVQIFNELLGELLTCINESQRSFNLSTDRLCTERLLLQRRILCIQNLQSKLWIAINGLMDYFSLTILLQFVYNGLTITYLIYWVYLKFDEDDLFINMCKKTKLPENPKKWVGTLFFLLLDIFLPCYFCDLCIETYGRIMRVIHGFKPTDTDILTKMCLREYSLQLTHQRLVFSCGGYFNINLQCFGEIVLAITTYIVILIQFKLQAEKI